MARPAPLIWTDPALDDLDDLASWIAVRDERAAQRLVQRVFKKVERLTRFPESGRKVPEVPDGPYREVVVPPCRIFYRREGRAVLIVHVQRGERELDPARLDRTR